MTNSHPVTNHDRAAALYAAMLGVELTRDVYFGVPHAVLLPGDGGVTGTLFSDPRRAPKRGTGTAVYLHAPDGVPACLARAVEAGAKVAQPTTEIPPFGRIALIEDLDGNLVGLHQPEVRKSTQPARIG